MQDKETEGSTHVLLGLLLLLLLLLLGLLALVLARRVHDVAFRRRDELLQVLRLLLALLLPLLDLLLLIQKVFLLLHLHTKQQQ